MLYENFKQESTKTCLHVNFHLVLTFTSHYIIMVKGDADPNQDLHCDASLIGVPTHFGCLMSSFSMKSLASAETRSNTSSSKS